MSFQDTFLGTLTVDTDTGMYAFEPDFAGVDAVKEKTVLIVEVERGTNGFVPPIWREYGITRIIIRGECYIS